MPLDQDIEALIGTLPAEQQTTMRAKIEGGFLRQDEYSRKMNETQRARKEAEEIAAKNREWWETTGQTAWEKAEARNAELAAENAELAARVGAAAAGGAGEASIDATQLQARVRAELDQRGYVSRIDVQKLIEETAAKVRAEAEAKAAERAAEAAGSMGAWASQMAYAQIKFEQEFGQPLDRAEFGTFMQQRGLAADPEKAMNEYVAPRRQEKATAAQVEKARAEEREAVMKELAGRAMPGSSGAAAGDGSPTVRMIRGEKSGGFVLGKDGRLGNNEAAAAAAADLVAAGKF